MRVLPSKRLRGRAKGRGWRTVTQVVWTSIKSRKSYLLQYHSPWHLEHLFAACWPHKPHLGFSGSKVSIMSKLYVWANLVKKKNENRYFQECTELILYNMKEHCSNLYSPLRLNLQVTVWWVESFLDLMLCYSFPLPRILSDDVVPYFWQLNVEPNKKVSAQCHWWGDKMCVGPC